MYLLANTRIATQLARGYTKALLCKRLIPVAKSVTHLISPNRRNHANATRAWFLRVLGYGLRSLRTLRFTFRTTGLTRL